MNNFAEAAKWFAKVPESYSLTHYKYDYETEKYIPAGISSDDFNGYSEISPLIFSNGFKRLFSVPAASQLTDVMYEQYPYLNKEHNKATLTAALMQLEKESQMMTEKGARAAYMLANYYYNISPTGYYRNIPAYFTDNSYYWSALRLLVRGANGLLNGVTVTMEGSDNTVDVVFDVVEEKTLPVTATTNYLRIADGYILYSTEVSKETVTLSGPSSELSKVATCTAEASYSSELTESVTLNTPLRFYTSGGKEVKFQYTTLEESNVDVTLQVYKTATLPVKVNFINAPRGFDNSVLSYALSCKQLKVAGPAEKIDALSTLSIGTIDLSTFSLNKVYEMPIELPTDIYLLDNISTITVSFDCSGLETKTMNLPSSCVQVVNLPATYQLTVETERLMNVILCGPKGAMETLTPEQVVIEIDAEDFAVATGQQNIACRLYVPSNGKIFALGSYVLQCRIESN